LILPVQRWYEAIFIRKSRRNFLSDNVAHDSLAQLEKACTELNDSILGARAVVVNKNPHEVFKGIVGSYGSIIGAPAYVAFIGYMSDPNVQEKAGYLGEGVILEATALNLATCWVGGFFKPEAVAEQVNIGSNEKILSVTPIGYVKQEYSFQEKLMSRMVSSKKRKDLNVLLLEQQSQNLEDWQRTALEAARLAPSAINRQPWRFSVGDSYIKVSLDTPKDTKGISRRLDCGIAMLHLELGAIYAGIEGSWEYLKDPDVAIYRNISN